MRQQTLFDELVEPAEGRVDQPIEPERKQGSGAQHWVVDQFASYLLGEELRGAVVPRVPMPGGLTNTTFIWAELLCAAICHQANWVRLSNHLRSMANDDPAVLHPQYLATLSPESFKKHFGPAFDLYRLRAKERSRMLRDVGAANIAWPLGSPFERTLTIRLGGPEGVYAWLSSMSAFAEDPIQKKTRMLIHQLLRHGAVEVMDPEVIGPAIDYHLIRLYVRSGRVRSTSGETLQRLLVPQTFRVEFVTHLRRAVEDSMWYTAAGAHLRIDELNHIEWQIARSYCLREGARCGGPYLDRKPIDESVALLTEGIGGACPESNACAGAVDELLRRIIDPESVHPFY